MEMRKTDIALGVFVILFAVSGIANIGLLIQMGAVEITPPVSDTLVYGNMYGPDTLDPQEAWDSASIDVVYQVFEGLLMYDLADPDLPIIPMLANEIGTWSNGGLEYTLTLRQGIKFHDGSKFNASDVEWSFDRLAWLMNVTGTLWDNLTRTQIHSLYEWPDGSTIINKTVINSEYSITFVLNKPFAVFEPLLTFTSSYILPDKLGIYNNETNPYEKIYIPIAGTTGDTYFGTGPYKYLGYMNGIEVRFIANDNYWQPYGTAKIENLIFAIITDGDARNLAVLSGDVDLLDSPNPAYYATMRADSSLTFVEAGLDLITQYIGFNNKVINKTWRQAFSYALDYDYMIDELREGEAERLASPLPMGLVYANNTYNVPTENLTHARLLMQSMGYGTGFSLTEDAEWTELATNPLDGTFAPFRTINFTYNLGNLFREDMYKLSALNLARIGVYVEDAGSEWGLYLDMLQDRRAQSQGFDSLNMWLIGWMPDYNDPSNYINSLMSNVSASNAAQINDPTLEAYMLAGLEATDPIARATIYDNMQRYIVEDLVPWALCYQGLNRDVFTTRLKGYPSNAMGYNYFYPCYYV
jgi:ABC-type transport system substrate-binding protein